MTNETGHGESGAGAKPRASVLIVDDQPSNLLALEAILEPLALDVVRAGSGAEALKRLLTMDFAVILLDVQMPGMDGFETASLIKQRSRTRDVPIVFLTAISKDEAYVFRGYSVGAVDYLFKPFHPDVLRSKVGVFVDLFQKNAQIKEQAELLRQSKERDLADLRRASDERYRDLAESMPQIVWTADAEGRLTYRNRRWYDCVEGTSEASIAWDAVLHPDDLPAFRRRWSEALETGANWEAEFRFASRTSRAHRWHLVRAVAVKSPSASAEARSVPAGAKPAKATWIGTSTDIDDRKRAEQGLRLLVEASRALASWVDYEATLGEVARASVPVLGDWCALAARDVDGRVRRAEAGPISVGDAPHAEALDVVMRALDVTIQRGRRRVVPPAGALEGGEEAPPSREDEVGAALAKLGFDAFVCVPIMSRERTLGAIAFLARGRAVDLRLAEDLARRVSAAVENAQLAATGEREREQLAAANRAKDEFLAVLSHELRTPLNSMLGWTQLARAGQLDEKTLARALDTIERNAKTQAQLIADLLDVSRIVTGKLAVDLVPMALASAVEQAVEVARPLARAEGVSLETDIALDVDEVNGDPARLQQVVGNLLSNAIKFTPAGGRVRVRLDRDEDHARLVVEDDGQGIDPRFLPYVFDRFRQAEGATTRAHGGLGLGLAIVRHIALVHGGDVTAESEGLGKGARFTVRLPLLGAADRAAMAPIEESGRAAGTPDRLDGARVLVVEDDEDGRELLEMVLAEYGARVRAVGNVADAVEALASGDVDVLISDIGLPNEDGYALLKRVRALPASRGGSVPAIALTAYASTDDRARALAAGFEAHVTKPVEPQALAEAVGALLARGSGRTAPGAKEPVARVGT